MLYTFEGKHNEVRGRGGGGIKSGGGDEKQEANEDQEGELKSAFAFQRERRGTTSIH